ncbi:NAD(P)/FAD-dependent oxidoreductase [Oceanospirillum linum]|uniref:Twin-arginine translocation pathway signal protein n=1 Tax=Oceanospirillum linum TaxID=966 RepID=A0A1T1H8L9_OCELI|nr:FAD/NAD(P)-binding oxidoreductase [Oceanospirillum linum]OOV86211.1 twin-arginine translocation pathway signal protein [Oceanospirillum linum]SEG38144.1 sulfide:quinone oxidoreductase [Oleiphilus messinensis]SMP32196.1 sulfide:quinone oxidoreductase [Oceanospirillum linum]
MPPLKHPTHNPGRRQFIKWGIGGAAASVLPFGIAFARQKTQARILILGAGAAGTAMANRLNNALSGASITIVGKRPQHYYQPGYTLIASGLWQTEQVATPTRDWLPSEISWIPSDVAELFPDKRAVSLKDGQTLEYDLLVVATGCQLNYSEIEGMSPELIGQKGIGSVYASAEGATATNRQIESLIRAGEGRALFTLSDTPIKCAGAPLKMTFTTLSRLEDTGRRDAFQVDFFTPFQNKVFSVPVYNDFVLDRWQEQNVGLYDQRVLTAIDVERQEATFTTANGQRQQEAYDFIHIVPPMSAPDAIRHSELAWQEGPMAHQWLEIDQYSLQHRRYPEIFGVGDVIGTPFGKTAASVKKQAPVAEANILSYLADRPLAAKYDGYTSCPLITSIGKAILAEFGYGGELMPSFSFIDPTEESWAVWVMKEKMLQPAYYAMLNGQV